MPALRIVLLCVLAAVTYGIIHDQITARVCIEYFTIGHPGIFGTTSPTLLGLGWGIVATWWVGLILGIMLAAAARAGQRPRREVASLLRPVAGLMAGAGGCALLAGYLGHWLADAGLVLLAEPLASRIPIDRHPAFFADLCAHLASYIVGAIGGIALSIRTWRSRAQGAA